MGTIGKEERRERERERGRERGREKRCNDNYMNVFEPKDLRLQRQF